MKIVIVGGTGVFGSRLARLLLEDGHTVVITGRHAATVAPLADSLGCDHQIYARGDAHAPLFAQKPDVIVDAAGPFHAYGSDAYVLARACAAHRVHYLDLSDDAAFTAGFSTLDDVFREAGCFALSGASSVPALSSAAVAALRQGMTAIHLIETVILPGNRAPRGRSVVESILAQAGGPLRVWRGGQWRESRCWSEPKSYEVFPDDHRVARTISVPDLELFPDFFRAMSVQFRAAMELKVMNFSISAMGILGRLTSPTVPTRLAGLAEFIAARLERYGTDRGGMMVKVTGSTDTGMKRKSWILRVQAGDGPFIPCIPVRTILRQPDGIRPGARPCLDEFPLASAEAAMEGLAINFERIEEPRPTLFQHALGECWHALPEPVQRLHSVQDIESFSGTAEVTRGSSLMARVAAWIFRFPTAGDAIPLTITKQRTAKGEMWERNFAGRRFRSWLTPSRPGHYRERFGPFNYEQELPVRDGEMQLPVRHGWFLGIPLPQFLLPGSDSREFSEDGVFRFDVGLYAPMRGGLIVRYRGTVSPDADRFRSR